MLKQCGFTFDFYQCVNVLNLRFCLCQQFVDGVYL